MARCLVLEAGVVCSISCVLAPWRDFVSVTALCEHCPVGQQRQPPDIYLTTHMLARNGFAAPQLSPASRRHPFVCLDYFCPRKSQTSAPAHTPWTLRAQARRIARRSSYLGLVMPPHPRAQFPRPPLTRKICVGDQAHCVPGESVLREGGPHTSVHGMFLGCRTRLPTWFSGHFRPTVRTNRSRIPEGGEWCKRCHRPHSDHERAPALSQRRRGVSHPCSDAGLQSPASG